MLLVAHLNGGLRGMHHRHAGFFGDSLLVAVQALAQAALVGMGSGVQLPALYSNHLDQLLHVIAAFEQEGDQLGRDSKITVTQALQDVFDDMRKTDDRIKTKQACRALDGVCGTKNGSECFGVIRCTFQTKQCCFHLLQQFAGFGDVGLQGLIQGCAHGAFL